MLKLKAADIDDLIRIIYKIHYSIIRAINSPPTLLDSASVLVKKPLLVDNTKTAFFRGHAQKCFNCLYVKNNRLPGVDIMCILYKPFLLL